MNTVLGAIDELTALSGNIGCILARWQKWSKVSLKGSDGRFRAAKKGKSVAEGFRSEVSGGKKGQKCRLRVPTGDVWQRKRPKALLKSSEVGYRAAKKAESDAVE